MSWRADNTPYKINSVRLQGIRGFNKIEEFVFGEGVTLIHGQNGSGKSSLLQAIEWAIIGNIPYMKKGDFAREDAIVNLFTKSKRANVEVKLSDGGDPIVINRSRKMSTKTSTGKQPLEIQVGDKTLKDDEAEAELENALNINSISFPQSNVLHQETIRNVLFAAQEERSQAIDKLLGTYEVREFAKALDADLQINKAVNRVTDTINSLQRDKVKFLINLKQGLEQTKTTLLSSGVQEDDLNLSSSAKRLEVIKEEADELGKIYEKPPRKIEIEPEIATLLKAHRDLSGYINEIDRSRLEAMSKVNEQKGRLQANSTRYKDLNGRFEGMKDIDSIVLTARLTEVDEELQRLGEQKKTIRLKQNSLLPARLELKTAESNLSMESGELLRLKKKHGSQEEITSKISGGDNRVKEITEEIENLSGQQKLITMAIERLETSKEEVCPVCSQAIDNAAIVKELKTKVSDKLKATVNHLRAEEKKIKAERVQLEEVAREYKRFEDSIMNIESTVSKAKEELRKIVPNFEQQNLEQLTKNWGEEIEKLSSRETELTGERDEKKDTIRRLKDLTGELETIKQKLQEETETKTEGSQLLGEVADLIADLEEKAKGYCDSIEVDALRGELSPQSDVLTYLRDEEKVEAAEKELHTVQDQINDLESRKSSLQALSASLQLIKQTSTQYQKEASLTQLKRLEDSINDYYTRIQGHPHFTRLKIDVEKEDPLIFSFRASSDQEDTYIPTRFSTAQLNAAALSIFLSNSDQQTGNLPLIILDDPTQNMDTVHKEAFAKLVATLPPKHQVILATEDHEVEMLIKKHCSNLKIYELDEWTPEGPKIHAE